MKNSVRSCVLGGLFSVLGLQAWADLPVNPSFSDPTVYPTQTTTLTLTLQNPSLTDAIDVALTNTLPLGMTITSLNSEDCSGPSGTLTAIAGTDTITLSNGLIPGGDGITPGQCQIAVDVSAASAGTYTNIITAGDLTGTVGGAADANLADTEATLAVIVEPVDLDGFMVLPGTSTVTGIQGDEVLEYVFRLTNNNPIPVTDVQFDLDLTSGRIRVPDGASVTSNSCGGAVTLQSAAPSTDPDVLTSTRVVLTGGGPIPANTFCEIRVPVETAFVSTVPLFSRSQSVSFPANAVTTAENTDRGTFTGIWHPAGHTDHNLVHAGFSKFGRRRQYQCAELYLQQRKRQSGDQFRLV